MDRFTNGQISRRELLQGGLGWGVLALASQAVAAETGSGGLSVQSLIRQENEKAGTRDWMLKKTGVDPATKYRCPWIEGYCSRASVRTGEKITFHVSTNPPASFTMDIYRTGYYGGTGARQIMTLGPFKGVTQPDPPIGAKRVRDCQWEPCAELVIPPDWLSGVYVGKLTAERDGWQSYVIFIVRDDRQADFIFQCSDTTWQAYNRWPSQFALYDDGKNPWYIGRDVAVSLNRPYGKYCQILDAPLSTGSGEWFLWEFPLAFWMESLGYDVTYISNLDTHTDPQGLRRARGWLSVGHDEYYSRAMFDNLKAAVADGLSLAFLSGNTCGFEILLSKSHSGQVDRIFERIGEGLFPDVNRLIGAQSTGPIIGGADWICTAPEHWIYDGTGLKQNDTIAGLVGWEWHGAPASIPGLVVVAEGPTQLKPGQLNGGHYTATVYPGPKGNFVFNASTCWWADGLSEPPGYVRPSVYTTPRGPDPRVQRITLNLLERMRRGR